MEILSEFRKNLSKISKIRKFCFRYNYKYDLKRIVKKFLKLSIIPSSTKPTQIRPPPPPLAMLLIGLPG